jgi:hypothetical protein
MDKERNPVIVDVDYGAVHENDLRVRGALAMLALLCAALFAANLLLVHARLALPEQTGGLGGGDLVLENRIILAMGTTLTYTEAEWAAYKISNLVGRIDSVWCNLGRFEHSYFFEHDGHLFLFDFGGSFYRTIVWDLESGTAMNSYSPRPSPLPQGMMVD